MRETCIKLSVPESDGGRPINVQLTVDIGHVNCTDCWQPVSPKMTKGEYGIGPYKSSHLKWISNDQRYGYKPVLIWSDSRQVRFWHAALGLCHQHRSNNVRHNEPSSLQLLSSQEESRCLRLLKLPGQETQLGVLWTLKLVLYSTHRECYGTYWNSAEWGVRSRESSGTW